MRLLVLACFFINIYYTASKLPKGLVVILDDNNPQTKDLPVYDGNKLNPKYDLNVSKSLYSCTPDYAFELKSKGTTDFFLTMFNEIESPYIIDNVTILNSFEYKLIQVDVFLTEKQPPYPTTLNKNDLTNYTINQTCSTIQDFYNDTNYWADVQIKISYNNGAYLLLIQYQATCDASFRVSQFNSSLLIMIFISTFLITLFANFQNIVSFKIITSNDQYNTIYFQGFYLSYYHVIGYVCLYTLFGLLAMYYPEQMETFLPIVSIVFSFFFSTFFIDEMICMLPTGLNLKKELFSVIRICDIVSVILAGLLILIYYLTGEAWYLNDILALFLTGALIKLFKFKNGRDTIYILLSVLLCDCILGLIVHEARTQSYNILVLKNFNCPLELQFPLINNVFDRKCAWISVMNIILPGLFIGYSIRFDLTKETKIYTVLSFIGLIFGSLIWIIVQVFNRHQWPQSVFIYPTMLIITLLWAEKRGELKSYLMGTFYDKFLFLARQSRAQSIQQLTGDEVNLRKMIVEQKVDNQSKIKISDKLFSGLNKIDDASQQEEEEDSQQLLLQSNVIKRH